MKAKPDARICDHKCDRLAGGECAVCEKDTCFDHGKHPIVNINRSAGRETRFMIDLLVCDDCAEKMDDAAITSVSSGTNGQNEPEIVDQIRKGGVELFVGVKALLSKKALLKGDTSMLAETENNKKDWEIKKLKIDMT